MKVAVIGTGFVGVVTSAVWAELGHKVTGLDRHQEKIDQLNRGEAWFFEPGLAPLLKQGKQSKRLRFTTSYAEAVKGAEVVAVCVGTPSAKNGTADLTQVFQAAEAMAPYLEAGAIVVLKSTVPPGTQLKVQALLDKLADKKVAVAVVPEFLREGMAVEDTRRPDRIVIGTGDEKIAKRLIRLHQGLGGERIMVSPESASMAKYTANAYLAQRITFINQIANLCERNGAKISEVIRAISPDKRIGAHYWYPGLGYGGSCFPKDVKELAAYARSIGEGDGLLPKIDELNEERVKLKLKQFEKQVGGYKGKRVTVLGLAFKPDTNDMREAPSLKVIPYLTDTGARVTAYDPKVKDEALALFPGITLANNITGALAQAEIVMALIEWTEIRELTPSAISQAAAEGAWVIDTRNLFIQREIEAAGLRYIGIGNG